MRNDANDDEGAGGVAPSSAAADLSKADKLADLRRHAAALPGSRGYPEKFDSVIEYAFSRHKLMLNAAQVRELAGGGSQSTAQARLDLFRANLHERLSFRLDLGAAGIPQEIEHSATRMLTEMWTAASAEAKKIFEEERSESNRLLAEASARAGTLAAQISSCLAEVAQLQAEVAAGGIRLRTAREEAASLVEEKTALTVALDKARAATAAEKELVEAVRRAAAAQEAASAEAADNMRRDHREQLATAARERQQEVQRLVAERDAAARERDAAKDRAVEADLARARADQQASRLRDQVQADAERIAALEQIRSEVAGLKGLVDGFKAKDAEQAALLAASQAALAQSQSQFERLLERVERSGDEADSKKQAKPGTPEGKTR